MKLNQLENTKRPFVNLKIALISDELTRKCLAEESNIFNITPWNYKLGLKSWKPDILFVESAWNGFLNSWKFKIASYPSKNKNNEKLRLIVQYAKDLNIPCVFWNKEDDVHFDRFISSASLFDYILTVDSNCISKYNSIIKHDVKLDTLMFAVQPSIHNFKGFEYSHKKACFVGSYSTHEHEERRKWQELFFLNSSTLGLDIYDRNSQKTSNNYKFPIIPNVKVNKKVPHTKTGDIYRDYLVSLNINTVVSSDSMFSRRMIEVMACGRPVISNPSKSISAHFNEFCKVVTNEEELLETYSYFKEGYSKKEKEVLREGSIFIINNYSYSKRIIQVLEFIN